jgi:hypothetical protein
MWDISTDAGDSLADVRTSPPAQVVDAAVHVVVPPITDVVPAPAPAVVPVPAFPPTIAPMSMFAPMPALPPEPTRVPTPMPMPLSMPITPMPMPVSTPTPTVAHRAEFVWPDNCELIYVPGTRKIMLTAQRPVMRTVFQEAFEEVHAYLLLNCAFPDASATPSIIRDALVTVASANVPRASNIYARLLQDDEYAARMSRLVSHFLLRSEMI